MHFNFQSFQSLIFVKEDGHLDIGVGLYSTYLQPGLSSTTKWLSESRPLKMHTLGGFLNYLWIQGHKMGSPEIKKWCHLKSICPVIPQYPWQLLLPGAVARLVSPRPEPRPLAPLLVGLLQGERLHLQRRHFQQKKAVLWTFSMHCET